MLRLVSRGGCFASLLALSACGGEPEDTSSQAGVDPPASRPSGNGACALLMQDEVDELFGTGIGAGTDEVLDEGVDICTWPAGEDPSLLLQIAPASPDIRAAVELGEGYRVVDLDGMSGPAAAAVEESDGPESVVVMALTSGDKTVTLSPVGLGITEDSPRFETVKALMERIPKRLISRPSEARTSSHSR